MSLCCKSTDPRKCLQEPPGPPRPCFVERPLHVHYPPYSVCRLSSSSGSFILKSKGSFSHHLGPCFFHFLNSNNSYWLYRSLIIYTALDNFCLSRSASLTRLSTRGQQFSLVLLCTCRVCEDLEARSVCWWVLKVLRKKGSFKSVSLLVF